MGTVVFKPSLEDSNSKAINKSFPGLISFINKQFFCEKGVFLESHEKFGITHPTSTFLFVFSYWFDTLTISMMSTKLEIINKWTYTVSLIGQPISKDEASTLGMDIVSTLFKQEGFNKFYEEHINLIKSY